MKIYTLKQPLLWYAVGTQWGVDGKDIWHKDVGDKEFLRTVDDLQVSIARHLEDEGIEDYFTLEPR